MIKRKDIDKIQKKVRKPKFDAGPKILTINTLEAPKRIPKARDYVRLKLDTASPNYENGLKRQKSYLKPTFLSKHRKSIILRDSSTSKESRLNTHLLIKHTLGSENNFRSFKDTRSKIDSTKSETWLTRTQNQQRNV